MYLKHQNALEQAVEAMRLRCLLMDTDDEQVLEEEAAEKAAREKNFPSFEAGDLLELTLVRPPPAHDRFMPTGLLHLASWGACRAM